MTEVLEKLGLLSQTSRTDSFRGGCECVLGKMGRFTSQAGIRWSHKPVA